VAHEMPERPCALHEGGMRQTEQMHAARDAVPGHLGLVRLALVFYQRHSAFASALLVAFKREGDSCATG